MENYLEQLFALHAQELFPPETTLPYGRLLELLPIKDPLLFEKAVKDLARSLPFKTGSWPGFGIYVEDWYMVELTEFKYNLLYCERGGCDLGKKCNNGIDLFFEIMRVVAPSYTEAAKILAAGLDRIADQRLLIWLRMSSEIFHMCQVNAYFGLRAAAANLTWMCEELVRMGIFSNEAEAFESEGHLLKGLMLSGMPGEFAGRIIRQFKDA